MNDLKTLSLWAAENALWALPLALLLLGLSWARAGSAKLRWWLGALILLRLALPALPWSLFTLPSFRGSQTASVASAVGSFESANSSMLVAIDQAAVVERGISWLQVLPVVWLAGVFLVLGWLMMGVIRTAAWVKLRRSKNDSRILAQWHALGRQMGIREVPEVVTLSGLGQIAVRGFWRPQLLVPTGLTESLTPAQLNGVLAHEMAHVRRWDVAWNWLGLLVCACQWFNPVAWLVYRRLRADTELICDEAALQSAAAGRQEYGQAMLTLLARFSSPMPLPLSSFLCHKTDLKHRIQMIAKTSTPAPGARLLAWLILPIFGIAFLTAAEREGERPAREGEGRSAEGERARDGDRPRAEGTRDGDRPKREGDRDGDGAKKEGARDGEGSKREGARDGDRPKREGEGDRKEGDRPAREGDGARKEGDRPAREGEGARKEGDRPMREGEGTRKEGDRPKREGEGDRKEGDRPMREGEGARKEGDRQMREGEGAARPQGGEAAPASKVRPAASASVPMVLTLNAAGQVVASDGRVIPEAEVKRRLASIFAANPDQQITIKGAPSTKYSDVMALMDLLHEAGGKNVGLDK